MSALFEATGNFVGTGKDVGTKAIASWKSTEIISCSSARTVRHNVASRCSCNERVL